MDVKNVKAYFESDGVVDDYAKASVELGLWASEEKIFTRLFAPDDSLLELGCGVGNAFFPLLELDSQLFVVALDLASEAIRLLKVR